MRSRTKTAHTGQSRRRSVFAVLSALAAAVPVVAAPANATHTGSPAVVQAGYPTLPNEAQRAADAAVASGALRVGTRVFLWPGANGRYDSLTAGTPYDEATSLTSQPTDDIAMVIQATKADCPYGWVCLFDWRDWNAGHPNAQMWRFQEVTTRFQFLSDWNAANRTASWWNRRNHDSQLKRDGSSVIRCMDSQSQASSMSAGWVDTADYIRNLSHDGACS